MNPSYKRFGFVSFVQLWFLCPLNDPIEVTKYTTKLKVTKKLLFYENSSTQVARVCNACYLSRQ